MLETVRPKVSQIAIPDWVLKDRGQLVEQRNFHYEDMIFPPGQQRRMGNTQVLDESRMETLLWFYYQSASYIDAGCKGIHFGQVEIMNLNDHGNTNWFRLISLVRDYAARHHDATWSFVTALFRRAGYCTMGIGGLLKILSSATGGTEIQLSMPGNVAFQLSGPN